MRDRDRLRITSDMQDLVARIASLIGPANVLREGDAAPYEQDWRRLFAGRALCVARPRSTEEVAGVMRACAQAGAPVVPQGGNTGLAGGASVDGSGEAVLLNLSRMDRIRDVDPLDMSLVAEAGVPLAAAQAAAREAGCLLPLSIASEGTAQIGGVLATNAGGNLTIRYGNARDLVLGIEVVLPDGAVLHALRRLRKDNTGYALRHLFVGSEGTLGVVTAAALRLVPPLAQTVTVLASAPDPDRVVELLGRVGETFGRSIVAFEFLSDAAVGLALEHASGVAMPLEERTPAYALIELETADRGAVEEALGAALEAGVVLDAVIAESGAQAAALWRLREELSEAQGRAGASVKNDVSVPVSRVARFLADATPAVEAMVPGLVVAPFGHVGDGNVHFNLVQPAGMERAAFLARSEALVDRVAEIVRSHEGSFSAEHGVGVLKRHLMQGWRGGTELALMRTIKTAIDPTGRMNPGKVLPDA